MGCHGTHIWVPTDLSLSLTYAHSQGKGTQGPQSTKGSGPEDPLPLDGSTAEISDENKT